MRCVVIAVSCAGGLFGHSGAVSGRVPGARGGEPVANVAVQIGTGDFRTGSDGAGKFLISEVAAGGYVLWISPVGCHAVKRSFHLNADGMREFEIVLSVDSQRRTDQVEVSAGPFETVRQDSPSTLTLAGNDAKNLGSVLAGDPLPAVRGLSGETSDNDFDARLSVRGADYTRIGRRFQWRPCFHWKVTLTLDTMFPILPSVGMLPER